MEGSMPLLSIGLGRTVPGAALLATLAFPDPGKNRLRTAAGAALVKQAEMLIENAIGESSEPVGSEVYAPPPSKNFFQRILQRDRAAHVAMPLVMARHGPGPERPYGADRRSLRALTEHALDLGWANDRSDFRSRILKPSLPVLHVAIGLHLVRARRSQDQAPFDHLTLLTDAELVQEICHVAQLVEPTVEEIWSQMMPASGIWRFRLVDERLTSNSPKSECPPQ
jgi:hypothetical protein